MKCIHSRRNDFGCIAVIAPVFAQISCANFSAASRLGRAAIRAATFSRASSEVAGEHARFKQS
jgi:hypothetical protein